MSADGSGVRALFVGIAAERRAWPAAFLFVEFAGGDARLNGKVATALMAKAADLFAKPPEIHKLGILANKLPK